MITANTLTLSPSLSTASPVYRIGDIPEVRATYLSDGFDTKAFVAVQALNQRSAYRARFYEATGILNTFDSGTDVGFGVAQLLYDHTTSNMSDKAYKYKVSYFIEGVINGSPVEFEGSKSEPVYLLGRNQ